MQRCMELVRTAPEVNTNSAADAIELSILEECVKHEPFMRADGEKRRLLDGAGGFAREIAREVSRGGIY